MVSPLTFGDIFNSLILSPHSTTYRRLGLPLTEFERIWAAKEPLLHMISALYKLLDSAPPYPKPFFIREWEWDLGCEGNVHLDRKSRTGMGSY